MRRTPSTGPRSSDAPVEITATPRCFKPRVCLLRTSQGLQLINDETVGHNFKIDAIMNQPYNVLVPADARFNKTLPFKSRENVPVRVNRSIYPRIRSYLMVQDHPYFALTDENGNFEIEHLPTSTWRFRTWHERCGYLGDVVRGMVKETWKRGELELTITFARFLFQSSS